MSFKPETDDMREAPSLVLIQELLDAGSKVFAYDPRAMHEAKKILGDTIMYGDNQYEVLNDADALVVMTEWPEFRSPDFVKIAGCLKNKVIFDGRNIYEPDVMKKLGFYYESIGRKIIK